MFESTKYPDFHVKESSNNQYKVDGDFMNIDDRKKLNEKFDLIDEQILDMQTEAYQLGRQRGHIEMQDKIYKVNRVYAWKKNGNIMAQELGLGDDDSDLNATLILDDGVVL
jgi:hypothetical protein